MATSAVLALAVAMPLPALAQDAATEEDAGDERPEDVLALADYLDMESVSNPQLSPDGRRILFTRSRIDAMNDRNVSTLWLIDADGSRPRQLMQGSGGKWSPSGDRIAFMREDANGNMQLFVRMSDAEGLESQVTYLPIAPRSFEWSPDGSQIAFVARVPMKPEDRITLPGKPEGAKWTEDSPIIDTVHYRQDRVGLTNTGYDHLFVAPSIGGTARQLTEGEWNVGQRGIGAIAGSPAISWSPDSRTILVDGPGEAADPKKFWISQILAVDVTEGSVRRLTSGEGSFGNPVFSPDGSRIAFTGYPLHDKPEPYADIYVMPAAGGAPDRLTQDLSDAPSSVHWAPDGRSLVFALNDEGYRNIMRVGLDGRVRPVTEGMHTVNLASLSDSGAMAVTTSTPQSPDVVALLGTDGRMRTLFDPNRDVLGDKTLGEVEMFWTDSTAATGETARVQGWIVKPPHFDPSKRYPLLLSIHGGPYAMYEGDFNFTFQDYAAAGYVVVYMNPRGSTGYGEDFTNSIQYRYPGDLDYADLMAGVDHAIAQGYVDERRQFITGCSGGGVLTTWTIAQTDRFAAAAALCPVTNWIGMSGTTDVVGWTYTFFPRPYWEDPQPWLANSPLMQVGKVDTPTLLITGQEDLRTPLAEAEQYFAALKMRGVPTRLVPMRGEYHGTGSIPSNYLRTQLLLRQWFEKYDPTLAE
ncbi:S9 family peptidase [Qipengyuania sp. MTN3-11]|uniref:S9 family peptidase n=1 Tax=Qipengyuania sp. MTN3-11 TaxID=3056557 RepID=UPI0036F30CFA